MSAPAPALPADLDAGLRRLRLAAMRRLSPELMLDAKAQRWSPEEFLRTLVEAEISSREQSNARSRLKTAAFPVHKSLDEFDLSASSVKRASFDYCAIRLKPDSDSGGKRTSVPDESGHRFRAKADRA